MSDRVRFSADEDDIIIEFVRTKPYLYNKRHRRYLDKNLKTRLWKELADQLHRDENSVMTRWSSMRDYFIRHYKTKLQNPDFPRLYERFDSLMFLVETSVNRNRGHNSPTSKPPTDNKPSEHDRLTPEYSCGDISNNAETSNPLSTFIKDFKNEHSSTLLPDAPATAPASISADLIAETNQLLHEILGRMSAMDGGTSDGCDTTTASRHLRAFFAAMADTVSRLPVATIARLKMNVARLVGEAELASLQQNDGDALWRVGELDN